MRSIDNSQDIIDSRDVIKRIEELEADKEALVEAVTEAEEAVKEAQETLDASTDDADRMSCRLTLESAQEDLRRAKCELEDWTGDEEAEIDPSDDAKELACLKKLAEEAENECEWESGTALIRESYFTEYAEQLAGDTCDMGKASDWPFRHIDWEAAATELKQDYSTVTFYDEDGEGVDYYIRN